MSIRIAFSVVRIAETQHQRRSLKPDLPIEHLQSQASLRLDGFCHPPRHAQIAIARHLSRPNSPRVPSLGAFRRRPQCLPHCRDGPSSETLHISSRSAQSSNMSGSNPKAVSFNFCGARAHRDLFGHPRWWTEGGLELVDNLLLLQPALPHPRNKTISYPLHILGVPL